MNDWILILLGTLGISLIIGFITFVYGYENTIKQCISDAIEMTFLVFVGLWLIIGLWFGFAAVIIGIWQVGT